MKKIWSISRVAVNRDHPKGKRSCDIIILSLIQ